MENSTSDPNQMTERTEDPVAPAEKPETCEQEKKQDDVTPGQDPGGQSDKPGSKKSNQVSVQLSNYSKGSKASAKVSAKASSKAGKESVTPGAGPQPSEGNEGGE